MLFETLFPLALLGVASLQVALIVAALFHLSTACVFGLNRFLWIWIATTSLLDLGIGVFSFPLVALCFGFHRSNSDQAAFLVETYRGAGEPGVPGVEQRTAFGGIDLETRAQGVCGKRRGLLFAQPPQIKQIARLNAVARPQSGFGR